MEERQRKSRVRPGEGQTKLYRDAHTKMLECNEPCEGRMAPVGPSTIRARSKPARAPEKFLSPAAIS